MDFRNRCKNVRAFIVLLAAMITLLLNIKYDRELLESLIILIIVIEKICNMEKIEKVEEEQEDASSTDSTSGDEQ